MVGDIHFNPNTSVMQDDPFVTWVCVAGPDGKRWWRYSAGQPHPGFKGYVLKPAQAPKTPPRWVKEASFRASHQ